MTRRWFRRSFRVLVRVAPEFFRRGVARLPFSRFTRPTSALLWGDEQIEWHGLQILANPGEMSGFFLYLFGDGSNIEVDYLIDVCQGASVVFDVGANRAWVSLAVALHCPQVKLIAFEPDPEILRMGRQNLALNPDVAGRITLREHAVGDRNGTLSFARSEGGNLGTGRLNERAGVNAITVHCRTVDSICEELGVHPDVIKIDVEGAELAVLRGMPELLRRHPPRAMMVELHGFYLTDHRDFYREIHDLLSAAGYKLLQLREHGFKPATPWSEWPSRLHLAAIRAGSSHQHSRH